MNIFTSVNAAVADNEGCFKNKAGQIQQLKWFLHMLFTLQKLFILHDHLM